MPKLEEVLEETQRRVSACVFHISVPSNYVPIFVFERISSEWQGDPDMGKGSTVLAKQAMSQGRVWVE